VTTAHRCPAAAELGRSAAEGVVVGVYRVSVDTLDYDPIELWVDERGDYVQYGRISFLPDTERRPRNCLYLNREWVVEGRVERYSGPVVTVVDGADADGGISCAELGRDHLRLTLDAEAAARIGDEQVLAEFDLDDTGYARLRRELVEMFEGLGVLRLQEAEPGAAADLAS
jgi:hypothetical protein